MGSYQCNCNAGYTGDGHTCSGESHHVYIENDSPTQIKVWSIKCDKLCSDPLSVISCVVIHEIGIL